MPTEKFADMPDLLDPICKRKPEEIQEYIDYANEEGETPSDFVWVEEGTLDRASGLFLCTSCYIDLGQPGPRDRVTGPEGRWVATRENLQARGVQLS